MKDTKNVTFLFFFFFLTAISIPGGGLEPEEGYRFSPSRRSSVTAYALEQELGPIAHPPLWGDILLLLLLLSPPPLSSARVGLGGGGTQHKGGQVCLCLFFLPSPLSPVSYRSRSPWR